MSFNVGIQFTEYGMSPAKVELCDTSDGKGIIFTDNDYFIIQPCEGALKYKTVFDSTTRSDQTVFDYTNFAYFNGYSVGSSIESKFTYAGGEFGLILRYNDLDFMVVRFINGYVGLYRVVNQSITLIGKRTPCDLVVDSEYTIKIEDLYSAIELYIDDINISTFVIDSEEIVKEGLFGIYGSIGNTCNWYKIYSTVPNLWLTQGNPNVVGYEQSNNNNSSAIVSAISDNSSNSNYIYQQIDVTPSSNYSMLLKAGGQSSKSLPKAGTVVIINKADDSVIYSNDIGFADFYSLYNYNATFTTPSNCSKIEVRIIPNSSSTVGVDKLQINEGYLSPFVLTDDEIAISNKSVCNLPVKLAVVDNLKISTSFVPYSNSSDKKNVIFSLPSDDSTKDWTLWYDNLNKICVDYREGITTNSFTTEIEVGILSKNNIDVIFDEGTIKIVPEYDAPVIIETQVDKDPDTLDIITTKKYYPSYIPSMINLGYCQSIDYARANSEFDYIKLYISNKIAYSYSFDGAVQEANGNMLIPLAGKPTDFAPISVQYDNGQEFTRISSFDENGNYTKNEIEYIIYDGTKKVTVSCSNIDDKYTTPVVYYTENSGTALEKNYYYDFIKANGNNIYIQIDDVSNTKLIGKTLKVVYCPKNSYSVMYNDDDSFNVVLHAFDGSPVTVAYERSSTNTSLVKSAIMNPFYNPNHSGFIYLTDELEQTAYLDIKVTPDYIDAKNAETALIIIDAYDKRGNIVSDADISIKGTKEIGATITRVSTGKDINDATTLSRVDMKFFAGRYIYEYKINKDYKGSNGYVLSDVLTITEKKSNIIESANMYIYV